MVLLKKEAKRLHISVNALVLKMIQCGLEAICEKRTYHDLDYLAGSWGPKGKKAFKESTQSFEKIDKELWE